MLSKPFFKVGGLSNKARPHFTINHAFELKCPWFSSAETIITNAFAAFEVMFMLIHVQQPLESQDKIFLEERHQ